MPYADPVEKKSYHRRYGNTWRKENPDKARASQRRWNARNPERILLIHAEVRAKKKGLPFNLTIEDIQIPVVCPVLGIPIVPTRLGDVGSGPHKRNRPNAPSLDRIKPELGYVKGNVQVISWRANDLKRDGTPAELRAVAAFVTAQEDK